MSNPPSLPSPQVLRLLLERQQYPEFIDLLSVGLSGSAVSRKNILSGWRLYLGWVREEGRGVLDADQGQAQAYADWLRLKYEAPATLNNRLVQVRKLYALLAEVGLWQGDAFQKVHGQVNPADERRPHYSEDEVARLLAGASLRERLLVLLGSQLGLTGPEILNLRFEDFSEDDRELRLSGRAVLPCSAEIRSVLLALRQQRGEEPLFGHVATGRVFDLADDMALRRVVFGLCKRVGVPYRAWMALRNHAAIKMLAESGDGSLTAARLGVGGRQALNPTVRLVKKKGG